MNLYAKKLAKSCQDQFSLGVENVNSQRKQWNSKADKLCAFFQSFSDGIDEPTSYKYLRIIDSRNLDVQKKSLGFITLEWCPTPVFLAAIGKPNTVEVETGARLTIAQLVTGKLICTISPFKSGMMSPVEDHLIVMGPLNNENLTHIKLKLLLRVFVAYSQYTSAIGSPTWKDSFIVKTLYAKSKLRDHNQLELLGTAIKGVTSVISKTVKNGA